MELRQRTSGRISGNSKRAFFLVAAPLLVAGALGLAPRRADAFDDSPRSLIGTSLETDTRNLPRVPKNNAGIGEQGHERRPAAAKAAEDKKGGGVVDLFGKLGALYILFAFLGGSPRRENEIGYSEYPRGGMAE